MEGTAKSACGSLMPGVAAQTANTSSGCQHISDLKVNRQGQPFRVKKKMKRKGGFAWCYAVKPAHSGRTMVGIGRTHL